MKEEMKLEWEDLVKDELYKLCSLIGDGYIETSYIKYKGIITFSSIIESLRELDPIRYYVYEDSKGKNHKTCNLDDNQVYKLTPLERKKALLEFIQ